MPVELGPTHVITPPVRLAFPALFEARAVSNDPDAAEKYMATLLIPPGVDLRPFHDAIKAAMLEKWSKVLKLPPEKNPIKDAETKDLDGYDEGWFFINTKSNYAPQVVDQKRQDVIDPDRVYAGCWCRFHINAYAYDHPKGGKGVSFGLNAVQIVRDDTRLDGRKSASEVFGDVEVEDDSPPPKGKPAAGKRAAAPVADSEADDIEDLFG